MNPNSITVKAVASKADQKAFLKLAWTLYADDPNWVPPLELNIRELLNYRPHPFYDNAEIQTYLAMQDGQVVGRIAAIVDRAHNDCHNEQRGMFGFFECVDDQAVAGALFDAAKDWLKDRGIEKMRGPANPSQNYEWGLLIEGFDSPPTFLMTYNKSYYQKLIETYGFFKSQDLYSFSGHISLLEELDPKLKFIADEAKRRFAVKVRPIDKKRFAEDVDNFLDIYNRALPGQWGFTPMSEAEARETGKGLKLLLVPELTTMAEIDGRPVATAFAMLDYNPLIKKIKGKLFPFGFLRLLLGRRKMTTIRMISTNVVPEYQRWGLGLVLLQRLVPSIRDWGIQHAEFSWVLESNKLSRGTLERSGVKRSKTHRIFDYEPS